MARVNHKLVKKLLNEQRSKITDKQFFTSRTLAGHFEDMVAAQTRRYHYNRRVRVQLAWSPEASDSANTNNEVININAGHTMVTREKGRQNRYQMVCGLFAHELGHVLYTDFLALQTQMNSLERGLWYPGPPALRTSAEFANEKALWAYIKADPKNQEAVKSVSYNILNVLEDGYVENRMLAEFPGTLGFALETMRMGQLKGMSTVTQMKEAEEDGRFHILDSILLAMLGYVKYGEIRYGDEPLSDLRIQTIFGLINELDRAVSEHPIKARLDACNLFLVRCWEHIQDYCEQIKASMDNEDSESLGEKVAKRLGILPGTTAAGVGGVPVAGGMGGSTAPATVTSRAKTHAEAEEEAGAGGGTGEEDTPEPADNPDTESPEDNPEQTMLMDGSSGAGKQDVSSEEGGRIPYHQTSSVSEPVGGTTEYNADYEREQYDKAASDIERVLDKMAERAACEQLENDRLRELNEMANNISYGDIHKGVHMRINRIGHMGHAFGGRCFCQPHQVVLHGYIEVAAQAGPTVRVVCFDGLHPTEQQLLLQVFYLHMGGSDQRPVIPDDVAGQVHEFFQQLVALLYGQRLARRRGRRIPAGIQAQGLRYHAKTIRGRPGASFLIVLNGIKGYAGFLPKLSLGQALFDAGLPHGLVTILVDDNHVFHSLFFFYAVLRLGANTGSSTELISASRSISSAVALLMMVYRADWYTSPVISALVIQSMRLRIP